MRLIDAGVLVIRQRGWELVKIAIEAPSFSLDIAVCMTGSRARRLQVSSGIFLYLPRRAYPTARCLFAQRMSKQTCGFASSCLLSDYESLAKRPPRSARWAVRIQL